MRYVCRVASGEGEIFLEGLVHGLLAVLYSSGLKLMTNLLTY